MPGTKPYVPDYRNCFLNVFKARIWGQCNNSQSDMDFFYISLKVLSTRKMLGTSTLHFVKSVCDKQRELYHTIAKLFS